MVLCSSAQDSVAKDKQLNFIVNVEKRITDLKNLKISEVFPETVHKSLKSRGSWSGILYGLCKVHKQLIDYCPPFRPIMSAIKTPAYNLGKFQLPKPMVSKQKDTFSGVYSNFDSLISEEYKVGLIFTLLFRTFSIISYFSRFHSEICHLKKIFKKNVFPIKLIDSCIKKFLNKSLTEKPVTLTAEKKDLVTVLPFLGKSLLDLRIRLKIVSVKTFPFVKLELFLNFNTYFQFFPVQR